MSDPSTSTAVSAASGPIRPDMVSSAVSFLSDPKVQSSTMSQRVSFLETKGLRPAEIDEAMRQANASQAQSSGYSSYASVPPAPYYQNAPNAPYPNATTQQQGRDWRDWFIMAVVSGTIGYGVISLAKKYLMPHLQPPNANVLEADLDALTAKYDEVASQLQALDAQTLAVKQGLDEQKAEVEKSIKEVEDCVKSVKENEKRRDGELDRIKDDVEGIRKELGSLFEKSKQAQTNSLSELQSELKSLKSLLVSRGTVGAGQGGAAPAPPRPYGMGVGGYGMGGGYGSPSIGTPTGDASPPHLPKPTIPAWQLAGTGSGSATPAKEAEASKAPEPSIADPAEEMSKADGKAKE
ncbi:related to PEX14 - peroxisomal protein involved in protein import - peroxin [Melanopsichium pennsylvanicum]|uniref:Peroxisomal membrane protein PEX14 n=2 Tax=Melanopsichium pennsylvanicum TaxID=63383 RepID=A0AAJ4XJY3_9BASI|nr:related to PEX14-peroxisomal protein involved in protein import-peroxin [Melanopsichium pennsylvanicum 4]SNX83530.1 related to PEX14 - peroxisomal protein involved in protein import - peroxin [Melanopsichium pennsylvanicum]